MEDGGFKTEEGLLTADSGVLLKASFKFTPCSILSLQNRFGVVSGVLNSTVLWSCIVTVSLWLELHELSLGSESSLHSVFGAAITLLRMAAALGNRQFLFWTFQKRTWWNKGWIKDTYQKIKLHKLYLVNCHGIAYCVVIGSSGNPPWFFRTPGGKNWIHEWVACKVAPVIKSV